MNTTPPPVPPNEPFHDEASDPIVDSLLREWLGEDVPPDLTTKLDAIEDAAKHPQLESARFTDEELLAATARAWEETCSPVKREPVSPPTFQQPPFAQWITLALAASLIGIIAVYPFWRSRETKKPFALQPGQPAFPPLGSGSDSLFPKGNRPLVAESDRNAARPATEATDPTPAPAPEGQVAPSSQPSPPQPSSQLASSEPSLGSNATGRVETSQPGESDDISQDQQIASVIDQQLQHMWTRLKMSPGKVADLHTLEDRLGTVLIGRLPTDAEREWARKASFGGNVLKAAHALARRWVESDEFDRHWAGALSDYYLDRSLALDNNESLGLFRGWLQESIQKNHSIGSIERHLISSDIQGTEPRSYWLQRWIAAGKQTQNGIPATRGFSAVGRSNEQSAALEILAFQGTRLASRSVLPRETMMEGVSYESLHGTAAAFASVLPSEKPGLYVSDREGRVVLVAPTFPDGTPMGNGVEPREALGQWFETQAQARQPMVDFVWAKLFGQPLVPSLGLTEQEGFEDRKDLLEFLANQTQSQQAGLKQIVLWVSMASPLYFESVKVNSQDFLTLDSSSLANLQNQTRLFAKYPSRAERAVGAIPIASLSRWVVPQTNGISPNVLAQPAPGKGDIDKAADPNAPVDPVLAWTPDRIQFEMSNTHPYQRVVELASQLAGSPLEWDAVVERAYLACLSRYPTEAERAQSRDLLSWSEGDRRLASSRLLNALLGHL